MHRRRFWVEIGLFLISAVLFIVTLAWPTWIESVFGIEPDQGDGLLEWSVFAASLVGALGFSLAAYREWRRPAIAARPER